MTTGSKNAGIAHDAATADATSASVSSRPNVTRRPESSATAVIEHYCEAFPDNAERLGWYFAPKVRHSLLTELGRIARPRSGADPSRFIVTKFGRRPHSLEAQ